MDYEPQTLESKWRERWAETGRYGADPDANGSSREPTFITVPYPYPSGGMHIGHARTYTVPDVYARYRRLQGDNVLFPLAWHVTGTPIIGAVERLKNGDEDQLSVLRDTYDVPDDELNALETPMGFARYFIENHYKAGMRQLGLSIDWRREFTTNDERYSKFITWQYETLGDRGLMEKGLHPVKYCTNEQQPVTTHDLLEGEEAEFQEYTLVRFRTTVDGHDVVAPMATLRPETVHGVTNAYVDPDATYVRATVDGDAWLISEAAAEKFRLQARDVEVHNTFPGSEIVGSRVANPITGDEVLVLPAGFVDAGNATGVVMSVPAHSPDDYVALQEAKAANERMREYGIDPAEIQAIEPVPILTIDGYGDIPARDAVEAAGVESSDDRALHDVTADLYQAEFHSGKLNEEYGEFAGEVVEAVREAFREHHRDSGAFGTMYEFSEEVVCRCGGDVEVAEQDTWFLRYDDPEWKQKAHDAVAQLDAIPENTRDQYDHTIDWLNEWPAIRNYGLGTRLPWDDEFVIEPLSDSTIYMAYYTIAHRLREIPPEDLTVEFFDTLFYGADAVENGETQTASESGATETRDDGSREPDQPDQRALDLREEWDYWYPVDVRCSANDLISNHLTFFLFHHAELFDPDNWPEGITVMGMGLLEGEKMSSSKGHVVLPGEAIERYGADTVRFFLLNSSEPWQDYDWRADRVGDTRDQLDRFWARTQTMIDFDVEDVVDVTIDMDSDETKIRSTADGEVPDLPHIDRWLLAKLQKTIRTCTDAMERFETRTASQAAFYGFEEHLKWYRRRADLDRPGAQWAVRQVLDARLRLLSPFVPFLTNELYEQLTGDPVEDSTWPEPDPAFESPRTEVEEQLVETVTDDVHDIVDVTDTDPDTIRLYVASDWKRTVFEAVTETGPDVGAVMGTVMQREELREKGNDVNDLVQDLVGFVRERDDDTVDALGAVDERTVYADARRFLESEFDADVEIYGEEDADIDDPAGKADAAIPFRPAVHIA